MDNQEKQAPTGPLSGVRVLDFTALLQGPLATQMLGDLGAEVIKFEREEGEWLRHYGLMASRSHGEYESFLSVNRNKKSVAVDLRSPEIRDQILAMANSADVVVENFRPGVMDRLGLSYAAFSSRNPAIVYVSASGYGQSGPYTERPGQDLLAQALSGAMYLTGRRHDPPMASGVAIADEYSGLHIVIAALAGLYESQKSGIGQYADVDLFSCAIAAQQQELTLHLNRGSQTSPALERADNNIGQAGLTGPAGTYRTADGYMVIAMFHCPTLGEILGLDWLAQFDSNEKMLEHRDAIYERLEKVFVERRTQVWLDLLLPHGVWCGPVNDYDDLESDPQAEHNGIFWEVEYGRKKEKFRTVGSPLRFSRTPANAWLAVPSLGQHTREFIDMDNEGEQ